MTPPSSRRRGPFKIVGIVIGAVFGLALIAGVMYGLALLFWLLLRELAVAIGRALVDGVTGGS